MAVGDFGLKTKVLVGFRPKRITGISKFAETLTGGDLQLEEWMQEKKVRLKLLLLYRLWLYIFARQEEQHRYSQIPGAQERDKDCIYYVRNRSSSCPKIDK